MKSHEECGIFRVDSVDLNFSLKKLQRIFQNIFNFSEFFLNFNYFFTLSQVFPDFPKVFSKSLQMFLKSFPQFLVKISPRFLRKFPQNLKKRKIKFNFPFLHIFQRKISFSFLFFILLPMTFREKCVMSSYRDCWLCCLIQSLLRKRKKLNKFSENFQREKKNSYNENCKRNNSSFWFQNLNEFINFVWILRVAWLDFGKNPWISPLSPIFENFRIFMGIAGSKRIEDLHKLHFQLEDIQNPFLEPFE